MSSAAISPGCGASSTQILGRDSRLRLHQTSHQLSLFSMRTFPRVKSLELLIRSAGWRCETFVSAPEFLTCPVPSVPNCLVVDAASCTNAFDLQKRVVLERPGTTIIFMASSIEVATAVKAIKAGQWSFSPSHAPRASY